MNAKKYSVAHKIAFINGDFMELDVSKYYDPNKRDSVVFFFDPPWGGLDYTDNRAMKFSDFKDYPIKKALIKSFSISPNVMMKLPRNICLESLY